MSEKEDTTISPGVTRKDFIQAIYDSPALGIEYAQHGCRTCRGKGYFIHSHPDLTGQMKRMVVCKCVNKKLKKLGI